MSLADYQRGVLRVSLARAPDPGELALLGDPTRFELYRRMIRSRLRDMAGVAFKQSLAVLGAADFDACFDRYLEEVPPRSPFIRDVVAAFGPFARSELAPDAGPVYLRDLLSFEEIKWRVAYVPARMPQLGEDGVRELDFEGSPVLNPTLALLSLSHAVHTLPETPPAPGALWLLVYRPPARDDVRWYAADALFGTVLASVMGPDGQRHDGLGDLVRRAAAQLERALDQVLLEDLASALTLAISRGVLIGVR
jgi:Putative DNA-binding domain